MSENFEEMQFTPANGKPLITVVKGVKPDETNEVKTKSMEDRLNSLSRYTMILQIELAKFRRELRASGEQKEDELSDDVSDCSNSLSDFSDSDSDAVSDLNAEECKVMHKIYHINLNFN